MTLLVLCHRRVENRAARLCTASNAFFHLAWCGSHTEGAYSSFGRTSALYARALVFCDTMRRVLRRKLSVLEASPTTLDMWVRQVRSSERVTPRYYSRCEACRGRKITYLNPPKLVILNFELQRRFAANYLFRQCIPGNDYTL